MPMLSMGFVISRMSPSLPIMLFHCLILCLKIPKLPTIKRWVYDYIIICIVAHLVTMQSMVPLTCATLIGRNLHLSRGEVITDPEDRAIVEVIHELLRTQDGT